MGKSRSRSRSDSPIRRKRAKERDRSRKRKHKNRSKSREKRKRSSSRDYRSSENWAKNKSRSERRRTRSRSESRSTIYQTNTGSKMTNISENDFEGKSSEEIEMMKVMGFCGFETTKNKKVEGNNSGAVHVILKRKYRQYMNRKGGFNRPLDFVA